MSDRLLTIDDAAELLVMTPTRIRRLVKAGVLPHLALPEGEVRFTRDDLLAWRRSLRTPPLDDVAPSSPTTEAAR